MHISMPRVAIVSDDLNYREALHSELSRHGCVVRCAAQVSDAEQVLTRFDARTVFVKLSHIPSPLPGSPGVERLYNPARRTLIALIDARSADTRIAYLERGADICLDASSEPRELVAYVHSVERRAAYDASPPAAPAWRLETANRSLFDPKCNRLELSEAETGVLAYLARHRTQVCDRADIVHEFGVATDNDASARLNTLMCRLQQKLLNFDHTLRIKYWRSSGYVYVGPDIELQQDADTATAQPRLQLRSVIAA